MRYFLLALTFVTFGSCEIMAQAIVCPPHLSYCYEKPILRDPYDKLKAEMDRDLAAAQRRMRAVDFGLDYQLRRAQLCNSVYQGGC